MRHVAAPTQVGPDHWPVLSAVRVGTTDHPAEFVVLADCGEDEPTEPYATVRVVIWPDRARTTDGKYHLTYAHAQRRLAELANLIPKTTTIVEVVVVRDPDASNDYTVFIDGQHKPTGETSTVRVVRHDIDLGASPITSAWIHDQLQRASEALSPAAARHARETVLTYTDDLPDDLPDDDIADGESEDRR